MRLATWNLENLHAQDGQSTYTGPDLSVKRVARDYERIRCYVPLFDPDILAVREVDGEPRLVGWWIRMSTTCTSMTVPKVR
jgi:hypothetical protein